MIPNDFKQEIKKCFSGSVTLQQGYIKLWRQIEETGLYQMHETFTTMFFLIAKASHKDTRIGTKYGPVELKRGQGIISIRHLANDLKLTTKKIRIILERLKNYEILALQTTHQYSIYTIVNYNKYQGDSENGAQQTAHRGHTEGTPRAQDQEFKNLRSTKKEINKEKKLVIHETTFEQFYASYPRHTDKASALKSWMKLKPDEQLFQIIMDALARQKVSEQWLSDKKFIPYPATWLNRRRWEDEIETSTLQNEFSGCI